MKVLQTKIAEVLLLEPKVFGDERGFFLESYNEKVFRELGLERAFVQDNHSRSSGECCADFTTNWNRRRKTGACGFGAVWDVAVDLRRSSATFGEWVGEELSAENKRILWIPEGFAHGFLVLTEGAEVLYKASAYYAPAHERTMLWNDPD